MNAAARTLSLNTSMGDVDVRARLYSRSCGETPRQPICEHGRGASGGAHEVTEFTRLG